jgi:excisionase family DNA binding protein
MNRVPSVRSLPVFSTVHAGETRELSKLLTLPEVAEILRVSPKTVRRMAARQRIPCVRFGRALRFFPGDILAWLSARREG